MGWTTEGSEFESWYSEEFSFLRAVQTDSGAHSVPGIKRPGHKADHSPPTSAEVKKIQIYKYTPPYVFMV
jgi:hypothetical protein